MWLSRNNRERIDTDIEERRKFVEVMRAENTHRGCNGWNAESRPMAWHRSLASARAMCSIIAIAGKTSRISNGEVGVAIDISLSLRPLAET